MKKTTLIVRTAIICFFFSSAVHLSAQNTTITDSVTYVPHSSAMLDVMSSSKGMLVPRLTSAQRVAISNPANGLLVFDVTEGSFFFYNNSAWHNLSQNNSNIWDISGNNVYLTNPNYKVGVGTSNPTAGLTVAGNSTTTVNDTLFVVRNKDGEPVFAVFPEGVRIWMEDGAKGNIGGFAVSGRTTGKFETEYFRITPDSVRIYINDTASKGNIGGFAVSGRTTGKNYGSEYLRVTSDSVRIYINQEQNKGNIGGFAVSGKSSGKNIIDEYLKVTPDSTRIYTQDTTKGFGVSNKGNMKTQSYLQLTPLNYFIGHESGQKIQFDLLNPEQGKYNIFIGYQAGKNVISGNNNILIGYQTGQNLSSGAWNTFIGQQAGYSCQNGLSNTFIGYKAGYNFIDGINNIFIGKETGLNTTSPATYNLFIGNNAGRHNQNSSYNTYLGMDAGYYATGHSNAMVGSNSGFSNTGYQNAFLGSESGIYTGTGTKNVCIGYRSGYRSTGSGNVFIGNNANNTKFSTSTYSNCIGIGDSIIVTANNQVRLGNADITSFFCMGAYAATTANAANMFISSTGQIMRFTSSLRYKKDIKPLELDTKKIYQLRPVSYTSINGGTKHFGLIAEDVAAIIPELAEFVPENSVVHGSNSEKLIPDAVQYSLLSVLLLKELQNHENTIKNHENTIKNYEDVIKTMQQKLNEHTKIIEQLINENNELKQLFNKK